MTKKELVEYLDEKCCGPSIYDETPDDDSGRIFVNFVGGYECFVPNDTIIDDLTVVRILKVLRVEIPFELEDLAHTFDAFVHADIQDF